MDIDPVRFYGRRHRNVAVRQIPDESDDSELSSSDDEEVDISDRDHPSTSSDQTQTIRTKMFRVPPAKKPVPDESPGGKRRPEDVPAQELPFTGRIPAPVTELKEPVHYFKQFFTDDLLQHMTMQSNLYATQCNPNKPLEMPCKELEQFIGMTLMMSCVKMPNSRMYWSKSYRYSQIADVMTVNRFEQIKRNLHLNDNAQMPVDNTDKLYKVRPLLNSLCMKFMDIIPAEKLSIDEQVVPFKGRSSLKTYNPKKPKKWGYKIYILYGVDGLIHNFQFYTGTIHPVPGQPDLKASSNIVLHLLQAVPRGLWHKVYYDNWFTGIDLMSTLWKQQIACVGTVRTNRLMGCKLASDAELKAEGRGSMVVYTGQSDGVELNAIKWFDNKAVTLLSTFVAAVPVNEVERWCKKERKNITVSQPAVVGTYNKFMGGVDLLDSLIALYRIHLRSRKWYHRVIFHLWDMTTVQTWLLYRREAAAKNTPKKTQLSLLDFKLQVAESLMKMNTGPGNGAKRGRPSMDMELQLAAKRKRGPAAPVPVQAVRTDQTGHWPIFTEKKGRCKRPQCKGTPKIMCKKCGVKLCCTLEKNCFWLFHQ